MGAAALPVMIGYGMYQQKQQSKARKHAETQARAAEERARAGAKAAEERQRAESERYYQLELEQRTKEQAEAERRQIEAEERARVEYERQQAEQERMQIEAEARGKAEAQRRMAEWEASAYMSPEALSTMLQRGQAQLGQQKIGSYEQMASQFAARGMGPGSGTMLGGASALEQAYAQAMSQFGTEMTKFGATPQYAPPSVGYGIQAPDTLPPGQVYGQAPPTIPTISHQATGYMQPSYAPTVIGGYQGSMLDTAMGMYMAQQMMKNWGSGSTWPNVSTIRGGQGGGYGF